MTTLAIKFRLIQRIKSTENEGFLQEFYRFLDLDHNDFEPLKLNKEQKSSILKGQKEILSYKFLTNEQANQEIEKRL